MTDNKQENTKKAAAAITAAALISIFVYSFVVSLPSILINEVVDTFSLEGAEQGLMGTLTSLGFMLSLFFTVLIQGRAQKSTVIIAALAAQALMLFICGTAPVFYLFCTGCVLLGFGGGFIDTFSNSAIVDVQRRENSRYLGYLHGLFGVGSLLSPLVFLWVLRYTDWRGIYYALVIVSIFVILLIFLLLRNLRKKSAKSTARENLFTKADLIAYLKVKRNVALATAGLFATFAISCIMVWIVRYMTLRYDAAELGALSYTIYWMCATANRFLLAQIVKRAPMKFFTLGAFLSGAFIITGIISGNPVVLCVMMGAFGFCSGHFVPVLVSESAAGYEGRTTFTTSLIMFIMSVGRMAAPVMIAFISTQISPTTGMLLPVAAAVIAAGCGWYVIKIPARN